MHAHPDPQAAGADTPGGGHEIKPYTFFVGIWIALLALTGLTVGASLLYPGAIGTAVAMAVTPLKAGLVLLYFMHLRWEPPLFMGMFLVTVAILATFMGLTFFDYIYR
jgi:cytochrome c oxidase subunit IV